MTKKDLIQWAAITSLLLLICWLIFLKSLK